MAIRAITFISSLFVITLGTSVITLGTSVIPLGAPVFSPATLHWSNADFGDLYVNCKKVASLYSWSHYNSIKLDLNPGDVVALNLTGAGLRYGAIADLDIGKGMHCQTKVNQGPWKAIEASSSISEKWVCRKFNDTAWSYPSYSNVLTSPPGSGGSAKYSPYQSPYWLGAEYVWAKVFEKKKNAFLRLVVPKECKVPNLTPIGS